jgi:hypothetical protein
LPSKRNFVINGVTVKIPEAFLPAAIAARDADWRIEYSNGHLQWKPPAGQFIVTPSTPGRHRAVKNSLSSLRRAGLVFGSQQPGRKKKCERAGV